MNLSNGTFSKICKSAIGFAIAKGAAFCAPILLLKFVSLDEYGIVEYSYSMGAVFAIVVSLGLYGAYPYFILKRKDVKKEQVFFLYGVPAIILTVSSIVLFYVNVISESIHFIVLFTLIFAVQRLYSAKLKSEDKGFIAVLIDSGYYLLLSGVIIISFIHPLQNILNTLLHLMEAYLFAFSIFLIWQFIKKHTLSYKDIINRQLKEILSFSYKMILSGFIVYWLTSSARIYINWFMGYEQVGIFSFYFRMAGISVVMYQFLAVAFFKTLYTLDSTMMDKYYSSIMLLIALGCGICYFLLPYISNFLNTSLTMDNTPLYIILCFQMPIWVGFALCESIIGRENVVNKFNLGVGILVVIFPLVLLCIKPILNLELYCFLNSILFFIAFSIQLYLLFQKEIILKRTMLINTLMCICSSLTFILFC